MFLYGSRKRLIRSGCQNSNWNNLCWARAYGVNEIVTSIRRKGRASKVEGNYSWDYLDTVLVVNWEQLIKVKTEFVQETTSNYQSQAGAETSCAVRDKCKGWNKQNLPFLSHHVLLQKNLTNSGDIPWVTKRLFIYKVCAHGMSQYLEARRAPKFLNPVNGPIVPKGQGQRKPHK